MRHNPGLPLPAALSGEIVERTVKIDRSLIPIVSGALEWITDYQRYEQTGTYTVEQARADLADMLYFYFSGQTSGAKMYAGMIQQWAGALPLPTILTDEGWLWCDGSELDIDDYADLYAAIGTKWDNPAPAAGNFRLPNLVARSVKGAVGNSEVGQYDGADVIALETANLPPHNHSIARGGSGAPNVPQVSATTGSNNTPFTTGNTGSGTSFSVLNKVAYVGFIIMSKNP